MASNLDFVELVADQIKDIGAVRFIKAFGEYLVYCNNKPVILICDNTAFVKILPEVTAVLGADHQQGQPYPGAKPHYVIDVDNKEQIIEVTKILENIIPLPKPKKKK